MQILNEENLVKVTGGANEFYNTAKACTSSMVDGFALNFGPFSIIHGTGKVLDGICNLKKDEDEPKQIAGDIYGIRNLKKDEPEQSAGNTFGNIFGGIGLITGGIVQIYVAVKLFKFAYKKLSKNERVKEFFS